MSTSSFLTFVTARRRGVILGALHACTPGTAAASGLLHSYLLSIDMRCTRDEVAADLAWLAERGLAQVGTKGSVTTAVITPKGTEVVQRLATVPGVDVTEATD